MRVQGEVWKMNCTRRGEVRRGEEKVRQGREEKGSGGRKGEGKAGYEEMTLTYTGLNPFPPLSEAHSPLYFFLSFPFKLVGKEKT